MSRESEHITKLRKALIDALEEIRLDRAAARTQSCYLDKCPYAWDCDKHFRELTRKSR